MSALNFAFEQELKNHRFARFNQYSVGRLIETRIHSDLKKDAYIPLITYNNPFTIHEDFLMMSTQVQLRGRTITKDKACEIMNTAPFLLALTFANRRVLLGKGFMGLIDRDTNEITPLFVAMVKNKRNATEHDIILYTSKLLKNPDFRHFEQTLLDFYKEHKGDIVITDNVYKYVGSKIPMPVFKSLAERSTYVSELISTSLSTVFGKDEEIIPTFAVTSVDLTPQTLEIVDDAVAL